MDEELIIAISSMISLFIGLTILWLFWMEIWAEIWQRRIPTRWKVNLLAVVMGIFFPITVPAAAIVILVLFAPRAVRDTNHSKAMGPRTKP